MSGRARLFSYPVESVLPTRQDSRTGVGVVGDDGRSAAWRAAARRSAHWLSSTALFQPVPAEIMVTIQPMRAIRAGVVARRLWAVLALSGLVAVGGAAPVAANAEVAPIAAQIRAGQWWLTTMDITKAWSLTRGANVKVGLIDTGVQVSHPDLTGAVVGGTDESGVGSSDGQKPVEGSAGPQHGTTMAGFIAARGHGPGHTLGLIGVAPQAELLSISARTSQSSASGTAAEETRGLRWAVDHGAKVVNMSFLAPIPQDDIAYAQAHDVVIVAGAGNFGGPPLDPPASVLGVVAVSGVDENLELDPRSSYGDPGTDAIPKSAATVKDTDNGVAVSAPFSDTAKQNDLASIVLTQQGTYGGTAGTSNATAIVSGVVALIRARFPTMNAANVINRLIRTASHPAGYTYKGGHGFGLPDAYRALTASVPTVCENPLGTPGKSLGVWKSILANTTYTPSCSGAGSSSAPSSAPASSGSGSSPGGPSVGASSSDPAQASSSSGSSTPAWVWVLIGVAVLVAAELTFVLLRRRGPGDPGGGSSGGGGGYGPPGYGPPGYGGGQ